MLFGTQIPRLRLKTRFKAHIHLFPRYRFLGFIEALLRNKSLQSPCEAQALGFVLWENVFAKVLCPSNLLRKQTGERLPKPNQIS